MNMLNVVEGDSVSVGALFGAIIAMIISWDLNKSILWIIIHGALSWIYVIYYYFYLKEKLH